MRFNGIEDLGTWRSGEMNRGGGVRRGGDGAGAGVFQGTSSTMTMPGLARFQSGSERMEGWR